VNIYLSLFTYLFHIKLHYLRVVQMGSDEQRRSFALIRCVHIRVAGQQQFQRLIPPFLHSSTGVAPVQHAK